MTHVNLIYEPYILFNIFMCFFMMNVFLCEA
jgi:hypothetical protein